MILHDVTMLMPMRIEGENQLPGTAPRRAVELEYMYPRFSPLAVGRSGRQPRPSPVPSFLFPSSNHEYGSSTDTFFTPQQIPTEGLKGRSAPSLGWAEGKNAPGREGWGGGWVGDMILGL